jgi:hypothetical protein
MVLDAREVIRHKKSNRYRAFAMLVEDAKFHSTYLAYAEGLMVPIHYGMWVAGLGRQGAIQHHAVVWLVLE